MRTLPARSEKALGKVVDLLADRLKPRFTFLLHRYERVLGDRIREELDADRLNDWLASREAITRNGDAVFPAFIASLRQECLDAFDHVSASAPAGQFRDRSQPLSLLDAEVVDEDGALAGFAARHEARANHPLMLLAQRFAVLLERPPLPVSALPVGPHAFARALKHAAHAANLRLHGRVALYDLTEAESAQTFEPTMAAVDSLLDGMGILPGLTFVPLRPKVVPEHPERGSGLAPEPGLVAEIVAMRAVNAALDELVPAGTLPDHRLGERREAVAAMVRLVSMYGPDSDEWRKCRDVVGEVIAAARQRRRARPGTAEWIRETLGRLDYSEVECRRLSEALVHLGQDIATAMRPSEGVTGIHREPATAAPPRNLSDTPAAGRR